MYNLDALSRIGIVVLFVHLLYHRNPRLIMLHCLPLPPSDVGKQCSIINSGILSVCIHIYIHDAPYALLSVYGKVRNYWIVFIIAKKVIFLSRNNKTKLLLSYETFIITDA